ncbi:MAG: MFS transporter [Acidimicrobiales bacterium]
MTARPTPLGRRFWRLWSGFALASTGDGFSYGAVPLLAVAVDPHPFAVSAVVAADKLPWLLAALPAGAFSDRFERGRVMAWVNIARGLLLGAMAAVVGLGEMSLAPLLLFVLGNGAARTLYYGASQAAVPELVPIDMLTKASGVVKGTETATEHLAGPILGTIAFVASRAVPFVADAAFVGASGLSLVGLRTSRPDPAVHRGSMLDGVRLLWRDRRLRVVVTLVATLAGLQGLVGGVMVLVATRDWGVHASYYGVFVAAGAVGNVPGALLASRIVARLGSAGTLLGAAVVSGLGYLIMAVANTWLLAGAAFVLVGFAVAAGSVVSVSLRQRITPHEVMGRVGSAWRGLVWGAAPVGALLAGGLAVLGGLRLPIYLAGAAQCLAAAVLARRLLRQLSGSKGLVEGDGSGKGEPLAPSGPGRPSAD